MPDMFWILSGVGVMIFLILAGVSILFRVVMAGDMAETKDDMDAR